MRLPRLGPAAESVVIPTVAIALSLIPFGIFIKCVGASPMATFATMYKGSFGTAFSIQQSLILSAPLLLAALCTALPARLGMVIIGGEGAVVLGGLAAAVMPHFMPAVHNDLLMLFIMAVASMVIGGLWIMLAGALKYYRGVNETISSLLLYYIAIAIFNQLVEGPWRDPASLNKPSTWSFDLRLQNVDWLLQRWFPKFQDWVSNVDPDTVTTFKARVMLDLYNVFSQVHFGFFIAIFVCLFFWVLIQHTTFGFSVRIIGGNPRAARVAGLSVGTVTLLICFFGGAAAGLAGMIQVSASEGDANASVLQAGYGFTGILIAFMARQSPLGVIPVALLLGGITASSGQLQVDENLPDATVKVLMGILFVMILASESYYGRFKIFQRSEPAAIPPQAALPTNPPSPHQAEVAHV